MRKRALFKMLAIGLLAAASVAQADPKYPERPVTLVVPFSAGGGTDATMRAFAKAFQEVTGQPMSVENRPGGGTLIALNHLKSKPADGYTLGTMTSAQFTAFWLNDGKGAVHPLNDIDYVAGTHGSIFGLLARADAPFSNLEELVKHAKANPDKPLSFGSIGNGTTHHLMGLELARVAGIPAQHISFKGEADSNTAAIGGHIDVTASSGSFVPFVEGNRLKVLGLATTERLAKYPQWKTMREQGYNVVMSTQVGIGAPKGIAPALAKRIEGIVREITKNPEFNATLQRLYQPVQFVDQASYRSVVAEQSDYQRESIAKHGIQKN